MAWYLLFPCWGDDHIEFTVPFLYPRLASYPFRVSLEVSLGWTGLGAGRLLAVVTAQGEKEPDRFRVLAPLKMADLTPIKLCLPLLFTCHLAGMTADAVVLVYHKG